MPHQLTEIVDTLRGYREGLGNLSVDLEAVLELMTDWERIQVADETERRAWRELGDELAATSLAFQRHVDAAALLAKLIRRLPMKEEA